MTRALLITELRLAVRSRRLAVVAVVVLAFSGLAGALGAAEFTARRADHRAVMGFAEAGFAEQRADHPHTIAHRGYVVSRPPPPLGFLDGGLDRAQGRWLRLDAHTTRDLEGARVAELVRAPGGGRFDLGLLFGLIAPAFVLVLAFDRYAAERRRGAFGMLRAAGLRPGPWLLAKLAGLVARIGLAVLAPAGLVALGLTAWFDVALLPRALLWLTLQALGLVTWGLTFLLVSALAGNPRAALGWGLAAWATLSLVVPPAASAAAGALAPSPPPATLAAQLATWADSAHADDEARRAQAVRDIQTRHPDWDGRGPAPEVVDAVMLRLADRDIAARMRGALDAVESHRRDEARLAATFCLLSPSGLSLLAGSAIAGSDLAHARQASLHYEAYRQRLMAWLNDWWAKNGRGGFDAYEATRLDDLSAAPRPTLPVVGARAVLAEAARPSGLLAALTLALLAALTLVNRRWVEAR